MDSQMMGRALKHTCWTAECPGSCANGAEDRIWCLALMASRNPSPRGPAIRERQASCWMHIGGTAGLRLVRGRCSGCACASVMRRSPLVRPWQMAMLCGAIVLAAAAARCRDMLQLPCPTEKASAFSGVCTTLRTNADIWPAESQA